MEQNGLFLPFFTGQILLSDSPKNFLIKEKSKYLSENERYLPFIVLFPPGFISCLMERVLLFQEELPPPVCHSFGICWA